MTSKAEKLLEKARRSRGDWKRTELEKLYKGYGFVIEHGSKHDIVYHEDHDFLIQTLPRHNKLQPGYARQAVKLIERLLEIEEDLEVEEDANVEENDSNE